MVAVAMHLIETETERRGVQQLLAAMERPVGV
jgi:hypothetical protein